MKTSLVALFALIPAFVGPQPATAKMIEARLCGGGVITIPIPGPEERPRAPCHEQGCHASCNRKRIDPAQ